MKIKSLAAAITFVLSLLATPALAESNTFPGKGTVAAWNKAQIEYDFAHRFKESKDWASAVSYFKKAISIYPYDDKYYVSCADCYHKLNNTSKAMQYCASGLALKQEPVYWVKIADIAAAQGDFLKCRKAANTALSLGDKEIADLVSMLTPKWTRMASGNWPQTTQRLSLADLGPIPSPGTNAALKGAGSTTTSSSTFPSSPFRTNTKSTSGFLEPPHSTLGGKQ